MTTTIPNEELVHGLLRDVHGMRVRSLRRFATGNQHHVYDVVLDSGQLLVARVATSANRALMVSALAWNTRLRGLGLPLPEVLFADLDAALPYLLLQRFAGTDLGDLVDATSDEQLAILAGTLMTFQRTVGQLPTTGRYGYAATPEEAPCSSWLEVLQLDLQRSRERITATGFVDVSCVQRVEEALARANMSAVPATPFLHDITTKNVIVHDGALCCAGFLSELGQSFNGNAVTPSIVQRDYLEAILDLSLAAARPRLGSA